MRSKVRKRLNIFIAIAVIAVLAGYVYFQTSSLAKGPVVEVFEPTNGSLVEEPVISIEGEAQNISWLSLNGKTSYTDKEGFFSKEIALLPGLNVITVEAGDRYGKRMKEEVWIFHKSKSSFLYNN